MSHCHLQELYGVSHKKTQQSRRKLETFLRCKVGDSAGQSAEISLHFVGNLDVGKFTVARTIRESYPEEAETEAICAAARTLTPGITCN